MSVRVTALHRYPVKSFAGESLDAAQVTSRGLAGDRTFGVVTPEGTKVTAREVNALLGLRARSLPWGGVRLSAPGQGGIGPVGEHSDVLDVDVPTDGPLVPVSHSGQGRARDAGDTAAEWLGDRLGRAVRLVWQDPAFRRPVRSELGGRGTEQNSLSDAAPILLTSEESLAQVNAWLADDAVGATTNSLDMRRFRPNVVVAGAGAFDEDEWACVRIGDTEWRATMVSDRCVMTTVDPETLERGHEPIRTLARYRAWDGATWFGVRYAPLDTGDRAAEGVVRVGDEVQVLRRGAV